MDGRMHGQQHAIIRLFFFQNKLKKLMDIDTYLAHLRVVIPMLEKSLKLVEVPCRCKE